MPYFTKSISRGFGGGDSAPQMMRPLTFPQPFSVLLLSTRAEACPGQITWNPAPNADQAAGKHLLKHATTIQRLVWLGVEPGLSFGFWEIETQFVFH
jgi:hypothetical protein